MIYAERARGLAKKNPEKELQAVLAAARMTDSRPGGRKHSPLYQWLWARHHDLKDELNPPRRPNWIALAQQFDALGIVNGNGKSPSPFTVRQTWVKVDRAIRAVGTEPIRKPRGRAKRAGLPASTPAPVPAADPSPAVEPAEGEKLGRFKFGFASEKYPTKPTKGKK